MLKKGLKFTPTPTRGNAEKLTEDVKEFNRKLRLIEYFDGTEDEDISLVRNKSSFTPNPERNAALDKYINTIEEFPKTKKNISNLKQNLSKSEYNAIKALNNDQSIVIKEADKGGTTVIMNNEHYQEMAETIINDNEYYEKLEGGPNINTVQKYNTFLKKHQTSLTKKELDYFQHFEVKTSQFYGPPKIHKSKIISEKSIF